MDKKTIMVDGKEVTEEELEEIEKSSGQHAETH